MTRDPLSTLREITLWRDTLEDIRTVNASTGRAYDKLTGATISLVELAIGGQSIQSVEAIVGELRSVLAELEQIDAPLDSIVTRSEERLPQIHAELHGAPAGDLYPAQLCACGCGMPASFGPYRGGHQARPVAPLKGA